MSKHVHRLRQHTYTKGPQKGRVIYFCQLPGCKVKIDRELALGEQTRCHRCDTPFTMNEASIRLVKPHCLDCTRRKNDKPKVDAVKGLSTIKERLASPDLKRIEVGGSISVVEDDLL